MFKVPRLQLNRNDICIGMKSALTMLCQQKQICRFYAYYFLSLWQCLNSNLE